MNKPAFRRRFQTLSAVFTAFALVGCITVGGTDSDDDECSEDTECRDGEQCDDGECTSGGSGSGGTNAGGTSGSGGSVAGTGNGGSSVGGGTSCEIFCDWSNACTDTAPSDCLSGCQASWAMAGECRTAIDRLAPCITANSGDCNAITGACNAQAQALLDACSTTDCPFTNDGYCDEPDLCATGTDTADCSCPFTNDGDCDEPEGLDLCPEGSDVNDCSNPCVDGSAGNTCVWACDEECDEPEGTDLCTAGTDTYDCTYFP